MPEQASPSTAARHSPDDARKFPPLKSDTHRLPERPDGADKIARLQGLITLQADVRKATTLRELTYIIANDTRNTIQARQIFVIRRRHAKRMEMLAISSLAQVERNAPLVRAFEKLAVRFANRADLRAPQSMSLCNDPSAGGSEFRSYPFSELLWLPLSSEHSPGFSGMLLAREVPWSDKDIAIGEHLAEIYAYAWTKIAGPRTLKASRLPRWLVYGSAVALLALAGLIPVPLTTLAPARIDGRDAVVVTAPIDGIIDQVLAQPNAAVSQGQPLVRYVDVTLRNEVEIAARKVDVASARERQLAHGAFADASAKHQLAIAQSELKLAKAELAYNRELLSKAVLHAETAGVAVYEDPDEWNGRPVKTGLRIMRIADPGRMELRMELPIADAIVAKPGSRVRFFRDSSPLEPIEATLKRTSYEATRTTRDVLAYTLVAELDANEPLEDLRIGLRGVAQVYGEDVPLFFFLFRKPIAALRQYIGV